MYFINYVLGCTFIVDDLREIVLAIQTENRWDQLALNLKLAKNIIDEIRHNCRDDIGRCRQEMVSRWLEKSPHVTHPSWKTMVEALNILGNNALADKVADEHQH